MIISVQVLLYIKIELEDGILVEVENSNSKIIKRLKIHKKLCYNILNFYKRSNYVTDNG